MRNLLGLALTILLSVSCTSSSEQAPATDDPAAPAPAVAPAAPAVPESGYVTQTQSMRRLADEAQKIDDPQNPGKKISNWLATLQRGEEVTILASEGGWTKVRASDDTEGWLKSTAVLPAEGTKPATTVEEILTFKRPDLNTSVPGKKITPGTLLFVTKTKDQFSEVDRGDVWVLSEKLLTDGKEIAAARMLAKIRAAREKNEPGVEDLVGLFKGQFSETQTAKLLDAPTDPAAPGTPAEGAPAEGAPAGGSAAPGPG